MEFMWKGCWVRVKGMPISSLNSLKSDHSKSDFNLNLEKYCNQILGNLKGVKITRFLTITVLIHRISD